MVKESIFAKLGSKAKNDKRKKGETVSHSKAGEDNNANRETVLCLGKMSMKSAVAPKHAGRHAASLDAGSSEKASSRSSVSKKGSFFADPKGKGPSQDALKRQCLGSPRVSTDKRAFSVPNGSKPSSVMRKEIYDDEAYAVATMARFIVPNSKTVVPEKLVFPDIYDEVMFRRTKETAQINRLVSAYELRVLDLKDEITGFKSGEKVAQVARDEDAKKIRSMRREIDDLRKDKEEPEKTIHDLADTVKRLEAKALRLEADLGEEKTKVAQVAESAVVSVKRDVAVLNRLKMERLAAICQKLVGSAKEGILDLAKTVVTIDILEKVKDGIDTGNPYDVGTGLETFLSMRMNLAATDTIFDDLIDDLKADFGANGVLFEVDSSEDEVSDEINLEKASEAIRVGMMGTNNSEFGLALRDQESVDLDEEDTVAPAEIVRTTTSVPPCSVPEPSSTEVSIAKEGEALTIATREGGVSSDGATEAENVA